MPEYSRRVATRGRVTISQELRERHGIESGDEIAFVADNGELRSITPVNETRLAEGYKQRSERSRDLVEQLEGVSAEATERLGDAPTWTK